MNTISVDEAEEIIDLDDYLARRTISKHRWYVKELVVFEDGDKVLGFHYLNPVSELQEDQERFEADPVPVFPVVRREVVTTVYERAT